MIIIIDAYNLLHAMPSYRKKLTDKEREAFIRQLGIYGQRKKHKIILVFDGGGYEWASKEKIAVVEVVYSGIHENADEYIKKYLEKNKAKDLLVVSSDRDINRYAEYLSIPSIESFSFYRVVQEALKKKNISLPSENRVVKTTEIEDNELDTIMMNAAKSIPYKVDDNVDGVSVSRSKKINKRDRVLLKKLYKL